MGTAAPKSLPGHWRRLSIALHCPHIYRPSHSHPLRRATTGRRAAITTSTIGPKARSGGIWTCTAAGTQRHSNCQLASKAASHRRLSHALQSYTLPLGPCTRCTSPILTHIGLSTVWPDKPRSQLCPWVLCNEKMHCREINR